MGHSDEYSDRDSWNEDSDWDTLDEVGMKIRTTEAIWKINIIYRNGLPVVEGLEWDGPDPDCGTLDEDPGWDASD